MKIRRAFTLGMVMLAMAVVAACGEAGSTSGKASGDEVYTLKVGTALTETDPIYQGLEEFKDKVAERTDGKIVVEIFGSGSLGDDKDILEQAMVGANVAVIVDSGRLAEMVPEIGILSAPYIVDNFDEANQVAQSELFKGWGDKLATDHKLQILSFNWYQGDRHLLTNKPIAKPADLQGLTLRTPGATVWTETIKAMGASPSGIAWSEVYPAVQQGVIDGAEGQHPATYGAKLYEVIDYITKTGHFQLLTGLVVGADWLNSLPEEYQTALIEEAVAAGERASKKTEEMLIDFEQKMMDEGVTVNEVDIELFKEATSVVYEKIEGYQELREQVNELLGK